MKYEIQIAGKSRHVELTRAATGWQISLDGAPTDANATEIAPGVFSILLKSGANPTKSASPQLPTAR